MIDLSRWERATWWTMHPDRCPNDFGAPDRPYTTPYSKEELEEYFREKLEDCENDLIVYY